MDVGIAADLLPQVFFLFKLAGVIFIAVLLVELAFQTSINQLNKKQDG